MDFVNIHIADAARNVYPPAVHGEKRYKKVDSFNKNEEFPSTTLTTLEEVIEWEQLQKDLPVDDFLKRYLRARADYKRKRERMKNSFIRTIIKRPGTLVRDFDDSTAREDKDLIVKSIQRSPEEFAEDILKNRGRNRSHIQYAKGNLESYHNSLIEHIRSLWLFKDDFEELDEYTSEMESSFDVLYNTKTERDRTTEDHNMETIEYGLLTNLYKELRSRYYFSESSLQAIDPKEIAATEVEEYYYDNR